MPTIESYLKPVVDDHQSGSAKVLEKLEQALSDLFAKEKISPSSFEKVMGYCLRHLGHFAAIVHFLDQLYQYFYSGEGSFHLSSFLSQYHAHWDPPKDWPDSSFKTVQTIGGKSILVHSNSSSVIRLFEQVASENIGGKAHIFQSISHPAREGLAQGDALKSQGWEVVFIEDAVMGKMLTQCDLVVLGSDVITNATFVNKAGSMPLVAAAHLLKIPVYVIGDRRKLVNDRQLPEWLERQLLNEQPKAVDDLNIGPEHAGLNYYFEHIPNHWVNGFLMETAVYSPKQMEQVIVYSKYSELFLSFAKNLQHE